MCPVVCVFDMGFAHKVEQKKASHVYGLRRLLLTASENDLHQRVHAQEIVVRLVLHLFRHVQQLDCIFFIPRFSRSSDNCCEQENYCTVGGGTQALFPCLTFVFTRDLSIPRA